MILFPPAKINLGLRILYKRNDGFHELDTCMVPIPLTDVLEIVPSETFSFRQTGLLLPGNKDENICIKAYELMKEKFNIAPVYMHLRKVIPAGAGLGGGSSDAAYVLKALRSIFDVPCSDSELEDLAALLGSDCPFFIKNRAQIAKGRGEVLTECKVDLGGYYLKIVNPGLHISTQLAYSGAHLSGLDVPSIKQIIEQPIHAWKNELVNDFESSVFKSYPELKNIKSNLYNEGAIYAAMSGSGSTMFGIYRQKPDLTFRENPGWIELVLMLN